MLVRRRDNIKGRRFVARAVGDELRHDALHGVDGHAEADARGGAAGGDDGGGHGDEAAAGVEQRAARICVFFHIYFFFVVSQNNRRPASAAMPHALPGLMAASVCTTPLMRRPVTPLTSRPTPDTTPAVSVWSRPKGLPMANTRWPT